MAEECAARENHRMKFMALRECDTRFRKSHEFKEKIQEIRSFELKFGFCLAHNEMLYNVSS